MEMWELVSRKSLNFLALLFWASELFPNRELVAAALFLPWAMMSPLGFPLLPGLPATLTVVAAGCSLTLDVQRLPSFPPCQCLDFRFGAHLTPYSASSPLDI